MGREAPMLNDNRSTLVAFDVDGTLTRRDSLFPFLQRLCGGQRVVRALARHGLAPSALAPGRRRRDDVKAAVLAELLAGLEASAVRAAGVDYAKFLIDRDRLRPDALARLSGHLAVGERVLLISASLDVYLEPLGQGLGVNGVLCTTLEVGADGRLTGRLVGRNCRGREKVARLETWLGAEGGTRPLVVAYGNSAGDRELLAWADVGLLVRPRRPFPGSDGRAE